MSGSPNGSSERALQLYTNLVLAVVDSAVAVAVAMLPRLKSTLIYVIGN